MIAAKHPVVAVTLGDPAGIGPELVARALAAPPAGVTLRVFGDRGVVERAAEACNVAPAWDHFELVELTALTAEEARPGVAAIGRAQVAYLEAAIAAALRGEVGALCTAPIHKAACKAAGFEFPGHTELLAQRFAPVGGRALPVTMMLVGPRMRVSLATVHIALAEVPRILALDEGEVIVRAIVQTVDALRDRFGIATPRVAIAGLNPHSGEAGHFGVEEQSIVAPAIVRARSILAASGYATLTGPEVPDVVFRAHLDGRYDAVVALYHDQGLIPVKLVDFEEAVNVTLGLPILRTSPDHGVAYDIAGRGIARDTSFRAALSLAVGSVSGR